MDENVTMEFRGPTSGWDVALLFAALMIDFSDMLPFNVPGAAAETLFLLYLGVPPGKSLLKGMTELVPVLDWIPWCTMAVLHRRYGLRLGGLTPVLFGASPDSRNVMTSTASARAAAAENETGLIPVT